MLGVAIARNSLIFSVFFGLAVVPAAAADADRERLLSHRVIYDMALSKADRSSDVQDAGGRMYYRFNATCDGWEVESRVLLRLLYGRHNETEVVETTWVYESFETYDGEALSFLVDHRRNGEPLEEISGDARGAIGEEQTAFFYGAGRQQRALPAGTLYPTAHFLKLIGDAKAGKTVSRDFVFDGASRSSPYRVNSVIIGRVIDGEVAPDKPKVIAGGRQVPVIRGRSGPFQRVSKADIPASPVWRIRMAFFPIDDTDGVPEFEIEADYREDGLAQRTIQDYGDFVLELTPAEYQVQPPPACGK